MNGRELSKTTAQERASAADDRVPCRDEEELRRWAEMVAGCLASPVSPAPQLAGLRGINAAPVTPDGWRPSVGELTPGEQRSSFSAPAGSAIAGEASRPGDEVMRIQMRVNTKEYGELSVVIERAEQGLRILLGAVDARVVTALRHEMSAVRLALESGGQSIGSLEIVRMNEVGTNLAQSKMTLGNRARRSRALEAFASNPDEKNKKRTRRVNLIG